MTLARGVGVRKFVDEDDSGVSRKGRVEIELFQRCTTVADNAAREDLKFVHQRLGFSPAMSLNDADDDIDTVTPLLMRRFEHGVRLPYAGIGAEEDLEFAFGFAGLLRLHTLQQRIGIWSWLVHESSFPRNVARKMEDDLANGA